MTTKEKVLRLLDERMEQWVSGEELAEKLEVSRRQSGNRLRPCKKMGIRFFPRPERDTGCSRARCFRPTRLKSG